MSHTKNESVEMKVKKLDFLADLRTAAASQGSMPFSSVSTSGLFGKSVCAFGSRIRHQNHHIRMGSPGDVVKSPVVV